MKYLLKTSNGYYVSGIIEYNDSEPIPSGYIELTKEEYDIGIALLIKDKFILWDSESRTFSKNQTVIYNFITSKSKSAQFEELRALSVDIAIYDD